MSLTTFPDPRIFRVPRSHRVPTAIQSAPAMSMGQIGSRRVGGRTVIVGVTGEDVVCFLDGVSADAQRGRLWKDGRSMR